MKKQFLLLIVGLAGILLTCGQLARASLAPAPNDIEDALPAWTADGLRLYAERTAPNLQHVITARPDGKDMYVASFTGIFRGTVPNSPYILVQTGSDTILTTGGRFSGPRAELHGTDATASPDGSRVAYLRDGTLYVARIDDLGPAFPVPVPAERAIASGIDPPPEDIRGPAWSADGTRIAVASKTSMLVVATDGSGARVVWSDSYPNVNPSWSGNGTVAWEQRDDRRWRIWQWIDCSRCGSSVAIEGSADYRFPSFSPDGTQLAFISDRQRVRGGATPFQFALYVRTLRTASDVKIMDDVHPYSPPAWAPGGVLLAVSAGQECRRWGIYVVASAGGRAHRTTNICRYDGTRRADTIHASPYFDIVNGLGGDDHLYGFWGNDKILGENGNDTIVGDTGNDVIFGGPGNDIIFGGSGNDTIIPGNGADRIDCGPGNDTVEGAGPLDHIAMNCEHVRR